MASGDRREEKPGSVGIVVGGTLQMLRGAEQTVHVLQIRWFFFLIAFQIDSFK